MSLLESFSIFSFEDCSSASFSLATALTSRSISSFFFPFVGRLLRCSSSFRFACVQLWYSDGCIPSKHFRDLQRTFVSETILQFYSMEIFAPPTPSDWKKQKKFVCKVRKLLDDPAPSPAPVIERNTSDIQFQKQFPTDILGYIFRFLPIQDLHNCIFVCHLWKDFLYNSQPLWKNMFTQRWDSFFSYHYSFSKINMAEHIRELELVRTQINWRFEYLNRYMWEKYFTVHKSLKSKMSTTFQ